MTRFRYRARTAAGEFVAGTVTAPHADDVVSVLRARALFVVAVAADRGLRFRLPAPARRSSLRARTGFFRCLATLTRAGIPLRRALEISIERSGDVALRSALQAVNADIERGEALSAAMQPLREFSPVIVAMVGAAERGGILDDVLERIATLLERQRDLRKRLLAALAYPTTVLLAALLLVSFLLARIVPMFADLFASFRVPLPPATRLLLGLAHALASPRPWLLLAAAVTLIAVALWSVLRNPRGRLVLDRLWFRTPIVGALARNAVAARLARMLGTLVRAGVDVSAALDVVAPVAGSPAHAEALRHTGLAIRQGESLHAPLASSRLFDPLFITLVAVGEESGALDAMLLTLAEYFEAEVSAAIATFGALVEPILIVGLGGIVGLIVSSVFLPLYTLVGSVAP